MKISLLPEKEAPDGTEQVVVADGPEGARVAKRVKMSAFLELLTSTSNAAIAAIGDAAGTGLSAIEDDLAAARDQIANEGTAQLTAVSEIGVSQAARLNTLKPFLSWSALAAATGMIDGDKTSVLAVDTGNHIDPVVGGTVNNAGEYEYKTNPATGWKRVGDLDSQTAMAAVAAASREFGVIVAAAAGIAATGYHAARKLATNYLITRFYAVVEGGSGTVQVSIVVNGVEVYPPVTVDSSGILDTTLSLRIPTGSDVVIGVSNPTGLVTRLYAEFDGVPTA